MFYAVPYALKSTSNFNRFIVECYFSKAEVSDWSGPATIVFWEKMYKIRFLDGLESRLSFRVDSPRVKLKTAN